MKWLVIWRPAKDTGGPVGAANFNETEVSELVDCILALLQQSEKLANIEIRPNQEIGSTLDFLEHIEEEFLEGEHSCSKLH